MVLMEKLSKISLMDMVGGTQMYLVRMVSGTGIGIFAIVADDCTIISIFNDIALIPMGKAFKDGIRMVSGG